MGMCLSASALVTAKVFIIELGSDKRVLVWISFFFPCVRGLCDLLAGVQRAGGEKEHFELIPAALTTPIITTALNTKR